MPANMPVTKVKSGQARALTVHRAVVRVLGAISLLSVGACSNPVESHARAESKSAAVGVHQAIAGSLARAPGATSAVVPMGHDTEKKPLPYQIQIDASKTVEAGGKGSTRITVTPAKGWHLNKDFPTKLMVVAPAGVTLSKPKLANADAAVFTEDKAVFDVGYSVTAAGAKAFTAKFKFAVCTDTTCDPKRENLAWNVQVK